MRHKKMASIVMVTAVIVLLIACSGAIATELYLMDLEDIAHNPSTVYFTQAVLRIESPGSSNIEKLQKKISEWFREAKNFREIQIDFTSYLEADIVVPVIHSTVRSVDAQKDLFTIIAHKKAQSSNQVEFGFRFDQTVFEAMNAWVKDEFWSSISIEKWEFSIELNNDTRQTKQVSLHSLYVDSKPALFPTTFSMKNRESLLLEFPDILRDHGYTEGEVVIGTIL